MTAGDVRERDDVTQDGRHGDDQQRGAGSREVTLRLPTLAGVRRAAGGPVRLLRRGVPARAAYALLVLVCLVVVGATVRVHLEKRAEDAVVAARADALVSAQQRVPQLLSYSFDSLEEDFEVARAQTTGEFADDYARLLEESVAPEVEAQRLVNEAAVSSAGVVSGDADEVVVLVLLTQSTLTDGSSEPTLRGYRLEVRMQRAGDDWLIAGFEPV